MALKLAFLQKKNAINHDTRTQILQCVHLCVLVSTLWKKNICTYLFLVGWLCSTVCARTKKKRNIGACDPDKQCQTAPPKRSYGVRTEHVLNWRKCTKRAGRTRGTVSDGLLQNSLGLLQLCRGTVPLTVRQINGGGQTSPVCRSSMETKTDLHVDLPCRQMRHFPKGQ